MRGSVSSCAASAELRSTRPPAGAGATAPAGGRLAHARHRQLLAVVERAGQVDRVPVGFFGEAAGSGDRIHHAGARRQHVEPGSAHRPRHVHVELCAAGDGRRGRLVDDDLVDGRHRAAQDADADRDGERRDHEHDDGADAEPSP